MIHADELGYIAWESLDEDDCRWLIEWASDRLNDLAGNAAPLMDEYRERQASQRASLGAGCDSEREGA